jgi:hypothetical protein
MSMLWFFYLIVTRRLPNQPFRKWDRHLAFLFILLTAVLIQWSLHMLEVGEIHQRRRFFAIAMGLFLLCGLLSSSIIQARKF